MFGNLFYILGNVIGIYIWICIIRVFLSWSPFLLMNPLGQFLCEACDPYLTFFRRFSFLQLGGIDFSPIISLGVLSVIKNICFSIYALGHFSILGVTLILISSLWQVLSFLLNIFILLSFLRFILDFSYKYRSSFFSTLVDNIFRPIRMFIIRHLFRGHYEKEKWTLFLIFVFFLLLKVSIYVFLTFVFACFNLSANMWL